MKKDPRPQSSAQCLAMLICCLWSSAVCAENWPRFLGVNGSASSSDARNLPVTWSETENIVWKSNLPGPGASSPVIWGDRIFLTCYSGYGLSVDSPGDRNDLKRHIVCLNKADGAILWTRTIPAEHGAALYQGATADHGYASHNLATDGQSVYVHIPLHGVVAYGFEGNLRWRSSETGKGFSIFGSAGGIALFEDLVIVNASIESQTMYAIDKNSGEEAWRAEGIRGCYGTPLVSGETVVLDLEKATICLDARTGKQRWSVPGKDSYVCPSTVGSGGVVLTTHQPIKAIRASDGSEIWSVNGGGGVPSAAIWDGRAYVFSHYLQCLDLKTGASVYGERVPGIEGKVYASPLAADGKIYLTTCESGVFVLEAGPEFKVLAQNRIAGDKSKFNASPAVSGNRIYLRSDKALYCVGE